MAEWVVCSPMIQQTGIQSQIESYQRLKKWYMMPPCLTLSRPRLHIGVEGIEKQIFRSPSTKVANFTNLQFYHWLVLSLYILSPFVQWQCPLGYVWIIYLPFLFLRDFFKSWFLGDSNVVFFIFSSQGFFY